VWGNKGYDRVRGALFNRYDGRPFFPRSRHITFLSVGAHFGDILDRYGALGRGPRLDDRIILVEPHPHTIQRLKGRIRLDHRLLLMPAAAHNFDGEAWFEYEKKHGEQGGSGRVTKVMPANATASEVEGLGAKVRVITIDTLMRKMKGAIDYIFMDADTHEPYIFEGMKDTLKRTRIVIFSCHSKWGASGSTTTLFDVVRDVFKPAGMTVSLLGEKRNLLLDEAVVPPELAAKLPDWGFCMATHTSPPITRKVEEHTRMMVGGDAWEGPCGQYFANLGAGSCNGGLLDTLDGVESPDFSKPKEQLAPVYY
jgi:FkbM family methyltransferase